jgi:hypothetical protein
LPVEVVSLNLLHFTQTPQAFIHNVRPTDQFFLTKPLILLHIMILTAFHHQVGKQSQLIEIPYQITAAYNLLKQSLYLHKLTLN